MKRLGFLSILVNCIAQSRTEESVTLPLNSVGICCQQSFSSAQSVFILSMNCSASSVIHLLPKILQKVNGLGNIEIWLCYLCNVFSDLQSCQDKKPTCVWCLARHFPNLNPEPHQLHLPPLANTQLIISLH